MSEAWVEDFAAYSERLNREVKARLARVDQLELENACLKQAIDEAAVTIHKLANQLGEAWGAMEVASEILIKHGKKGLDAT